MHEHPNLASLQTAFGVHVLRRLAEADGIIDYSEMQMVERAYPTARLRTLGFVGTDGFTDTFHAAVGQAIAELPAAMHPAAKLALLSSFHDVAISDGDLHPDELRVIYEAAGVLGVSRADLGVYLDAQTLGADSAVPPVRRR